MSGCGEIVLVGGKTGEDGIERSPTAKNMQQSSSNVSLIEDREYSKLMANLIVISDIRNSLS